MADNNSILQANINNNNYIHTSRSYFEYYNLILSFFRFNYKQLLLSLQYWVLDIFLLFIRNQA